AAYGMALAAREDATDGGLEAAGKVLVATRPTAVNLRWAVERMLRTLRKLPENQRVAAAYQLAAEICEEDVAFCSAIGGHGAGVIAKIARQKESGCVNLLTHCNAGWLCAV